MYNPPLRIFLPAPPNYFYNNFFFNDEFLKMT